MAPPDARHGGLEVGSSEVAVVVIEGTHELPISHSYYFLLLTDWGADILGHAPGQRTENLSTNSSSLLAVYSCLQLEREDTFVHCWASPHSQGFEDKNWGVSPACLGSRRNSPNPHLQTLANDGMPNSVYKFSVLCLGAWPGMSAPQSIIKRKYSAYRL